MKAINAIGTGMIGIFVPIYIIELGYGIQIALIWLLIHHISISFGAFIVMKVSNRIGLVRCWYVRLVLISIFLISLLFIGTNNVQTLLLLAVVSGLEAAFFWIPFNIMLVRSTDEGHMARSLAFVENVRSTVGIFVPAVAASVIVLFGYNMFFVVSLVIILVSIIPVLGIPNEPTHFNFNKKHLWSVLRENKSHIIPEIIKNLAYESKIILLLFVFISGFTVLDVGLLETIGVFLGVMATYVVGALSDVWKKEVVLKITAVLVSLVSLGVWYIGTINPTPLLLFIIILTSGIALKSFATSYNSYVFNRARGNEEEFLVMIEIPNLIGRFILFSLCVVLYKSLPIIFLFISIVFIFFWFVDASEL